MVATTFGTPNTLPLRPMLERDEMLALPASLSSQMAAHRFTVPAAPSYEVEAMRAMDWVVAEQEKAGKGKDDIKAAIVYQQDDYGQDGLNGWKKAAAHHGVSIVSEQTVTPGQRDVTAVVSSLKSAGATHVLLTILPSATGPVLGTAAQLQWSPVWIGQTPAWIDGFFSPDVIPSAVFGNFHWVTGLPYWGEDLPNMKAFLAAYEKYGKDQSRPDFYLLTSYLQGLYAVEVLKGALEAGDLTRAGLLKAVQSIDSFDGAGFMPEISTSTFPYVTGTSTRMLRPDFEKKSWTVLSDYAAPAALGAKVEAPVAEAAAADTDSEAKVEAAAAPAAAD
jgi:ABC-type branched-subunit amino acid transport system substrate-binding protein